jgi:outer membrane protein OmpA-like peptidoglycan-associated protein
MYRCVQRPNRTSRARTACPARRGPGSHPLDLDPRSIEHSHPAGQEPLQGLHTTAPRVGEATGSSGRPLDAAARAYFEPRFGHDLGRVRVHAGPRAAASALAMGASAYTLGEHIVLGGDARPFHTEAGRRLLAHELAHVVQQRTGGTETPADPRSAEAEASRAAERVAAGSAYAIQAHAPRAVPMRQPLPQGAGPFRLDEPSLGESLRGPSRRSTSTTHVLQAFATDSAELTSDHEARLDAIAADLNASPLVFGGFVTIVGYADRRGTEEHNKQLGQRRADAVRARLLALVTDEDTKAEIRAYSLGEPEEGPAGDVPEFRKVTITITRRSTGISLLPPSTGPTLPTPIPRIDVFPRPGPILPGPEPGPRLPDWFWRPLPPAPAPFLNQLSRWITGHIGRGDIARIAASIAGRIGFDESQVRKDLDEAMVSGGEEGLKELLRAFLERIAGPPVGRPENPYGPPVSELPRPPILSLPPIRF